MTVKQLDEEIDYKPAQGKLNIVYEDDYLLIINKEPGIIIHNGKDNLDSLSNLVEINLQKLFI